jgi:hypothetical protein
MQRLLFVGFGLMAACGWMAVGAKAWAADGTEPQISQIKTLDEARAYLAWKRNVVERLLPESTTSAGVRDYVERTRGVTASDYLIGPGLGRDNARVYRVTLNSAAKGSSSRELVFDVIVDATTGSILGEDIVLL